MKSPICSENLKKEIAKIFIGKEKQIELIIIGIFAGGHILLDDLPGSGKTVLIKTISKALGCDFKRIQFTPDLMPSDIIGMTIFDRNESQFKLVKGPIFTNILLADEINRAIPRTQSALLEAMEELQVSIDNKAFNLDEPFFVMATENPVERESTFQLPAAEMDRFFMKLSLGFPSKEEESLMLETVGDQIDFSKVNVISSPSELMEIRNEIQEVKVSDFVREYIVSLVQATRNNPSFKYGGSPRASRSLYQGGKSLAAIKGRDFVTPEDIQEIFIPVLNHRVVLSSEAKYTKKTAEEILQNILEETAVPPEKSQMFNGNSAQ